MEARLTQASNKQLSKLIISNLAGTLGSAILTFVIGLIILKHSDSALYFGLSQAVGPVVSLLLLPFTGSLVDKYNKQHIIVWAQGLSILALGLFAGFIATTHLTSNLLMVFLLLIALKISDQFLSTASMAAATNLVVEEHVHKLKSIEQTIGALSQFIAPIAGVALYAMLPLEYLVGLEIVLEALVIIITLTLNFRLVAHHQADAQASLFSLFKEGLDFIKAHKKFQHTVALFMFINLLITGVIVGMPYVQVKVLNFSDFYYGISEAALSLGFILVGIYLSTRKAVSYPLRLAWKSIMIIGGLITLTGAVLLLPLSTDAFFAIFLLINLIFGGFSTAINIPMMTWITQVVPTHYQGRIFNIVTTTSQLLTPLGMVAFSIGFDYLPASLLFLLCGAIMVGVTAYWPRFYKVNILSNQLED
ncbi:MFS transporter [Abiotrophia sp.]|uniref:MFS transporter n=1 Tax=Abiotrophia sp. TaxID=76631 RepID=UPI0027BA6730|nr:MFS transporter [Abiotrophia sp.]